MNNITELNRNNQKICISTTKCVVTNFSELDAADGEGLLAILPRNSLVTALYVYHPETDNTHIDIEINGVKRVDNLNLATAGIKTETAKYMLPTGGNIVIRDIDKALSSTVTIVVEYYELDKRSGEFTVVNRDVFA